MEVDGEDHAEAQQPADDGVAIGTGAPIVVGGADLQLDQHVLPVPHAEIDKVNNAAFANARVITITEVGQFLEDFKQSAASKGSFVHNDVHQVYDYCTTFAPRRTDASERIVRQRAAAAIQHPYYWGLVMNLSPETPDELVHLVPELDPRRNPATSPFEDEDAIRVLIEEMEAHRTGDV
eukprot:jgi/Ulvmu1/11359/UM075_0019.1